MTAIIATTSDSNETKEYFEKIAQKVKVFLEAPNHLRDICLDSNGDCSACRWTIECRERNDGVNYENR
jgi:hypothetical protein